MISDERLRRWCDMIAATDSKFEFRLGLEEGTRWEAEAPYPDLAVVSKKEIHVRRFVMQELVVEAETPEDDQAARVLVRRLVAELEDGNEIELSRHAQQAEERQGYTGQPDVCCACDGKICDQSEIVTYEGKPYHRRCMS